MLVCWRGRATRQTLQERCQNSLPRLNLPNQACNDIELFRMVSEFSPPPFRLPTSRGWLVDKCLPKPVNVEPVILSQSSQLQNEVRREINFLCNPCPELLFHRVRARQKKKQGATNNFFYFCSKKAGQAVPTLVHEMLSQELLRLARNLGRSVVVSFVFFYFMYVWMDILFMVVSIVQFK